MINDYYIEKLTEKYHNIHDVDSDLVFKGKLFGDIPLNLNWQLLANDIFDVPRELTSNKSNLSYLNRLYQNYLAWKTEEDEEFFGEVITSEDYRSFAHKIRNALNNYERIVVVGAGGYMTNLWYIYNMFLSGTAIVSYDMPLIDVYDDDSFTYDNIGRIFAPLNPRAVTRKRIDMPDATRADPFQVVSKAMNFKYTMDNFNISDEERRLKSDAYCFDRGFKTLYLGSPDVRTREMLRNKGVEFYFFGHHSDTTEILYRPSSEMDLAVESYGRMYIRGFWAGIFHSAISFIDLLVEESTFEDGESLAKFKHRKAKDVDL